MNTVKFNLSFKLSQIFKLKKTKIKEFKEFISYSIGDKQHCVMYVGFKTLKYILPELITFPYYTRIMFNPPDETIQINFYKI